MILGGLGIAATAFVPSYSVIGREVVRRGPYGEIRITSHGAQTLSPWDLYRTTTPLWITWLLFLPQLFGVSTALVHVVDCAPEAVRGTYKTLIILGLVPIVFGAVAYGVGALIVLLVDRDSWAMSLGLLAAAALLFFVFVAAMRATTRTEVQRHSPYLRLLLYQGVLAIFAAGWLLIIAVAEKATLPVHWVGLPAVGVMLVGTHLAARLARRSMNSVGAQVTAA